MGVNVEGKGKVWVKYFEGGNAAYSISISNKDQNGGWINAYQHVRFKNDMPMPENGDYITFKGFATVSKGRERTSVLWQITEYSKVDDGPAEQPKGYTQQNKAYTPLADNDIPF